MRASKTQCDGVAAEKLYQHGAPLGSPALVHGSYQQACYCFAHLPERALASSAVRVIVELGKDGLSLLHLAGTACMLIGSSATQQLRHNSYSPACSDLGQPQERVLGLGAL